MNGNTHLEKVKKFHDWDAEQYKRLRYHSDSCEGLAYVTRQELVMASADIEEGKVLDVGCGPGIFTPFLLNKKVEVYSFDLSIEMIKEARQGVADHPLASNGYFTVSNVSDVCYQDNVMDMILCVGVVCYIKNYNTLLAETKRVLKPGGRLVIQIDKIKWPTIYNQFVPLYHYVKSKITSKSYQELNFKFNYFVYHDFIRDLESNGFRIIDMQCFDFRIPFVDIIFPRLSLKLGKIMFRKRAVKVLCCLAHGLLINAQKIL